MSKSPSPSTSDEPEFIVTRETFNQFFDSPLPTSTFHDLVAKGKIKRWPSMQGRFFLNESLRRMKLPTVKSLPNQPGRASLENITRLAFTLIDPLLFPAPPWLLKYESIELVDAQLSGRIAEEHRDDLQSIEHPHTKLAYFAGVLDAQFMLENDSA
ncbi:MAG: hypothetical protein ACSHYB_08705 [Roseibacillus sp.]